MKRINEIDFLKGILIILVAIGHVNAAQLPRFINFIYLFHMPAFFILSGMTYKNINTNEFFSFLKNCTLKYLLPYFCYLLILSFYSYNCFYHEPIINFLIGGKSLTGLLGVFWFITCLYFTLILFTIINTFIHNKHIKFVIILFIYISGILLIKYVTNDYQIPWSLDVVLVALIYIAIGYYFKNYIINNGKIIGFSIIGSAVITILLYFNVIDITFRMKGDELYHNPILQIIFPSFVTITLLYFSKVISKIKILSKILNNIGKRSLTIMYLHIPVYVTLMKLNILNPIILPVLSVALPYAISYFIFEKNKILSFLFLGKKIN